MIGMVAHEPRAARHSAGHRDGRLPASGKMHWHIASSAAEFGGYSAVAIIIVEDHADYALAAFKTQRAPLDAAAIWCPPFCSNHF